jgi:hypothetical protein
LFFVNSRARLFYSIKPTKAWWQTFVRLVYLHHNVAIDAMRIAHANRDMRLAHATSAASITGLIKKRALRTILRAQSFRTRHHDALTAPPKQGHRRPIEPGRLLA